MTEEERVSMDNLVLGILHFVLAELIGVFLVLLLILANRFSHFMWKTVSKKKRSWVFGYLAYMAMAIGSMSIAAGGVYMILELMGMIERSELRWVYLLLSVIGIILGLIVAIQKKWGRPVAQSVREFITQPPPGP